MNLKSVSSARLLKNLAVASLAAVAFLPVSVAAETHLEGPCPGADLGENCIIVFAQVGETFEYQLANEQDGAEARVREALNAEGERYSLPKGISFDRETLSLRGMPERAGFHEFVLLVTEDGVTEERVLLIDVKDKSNPIARNAYASSVWVDIH